VATVRYSCHKFQLDPEETECRTPHMPPAACPRCRRFQLDRRAAYIGILFYAGFQAFYTTLVMKQQ